MDKSLYIHIPFCTHLCHYCDFTKVIYDKNLSHTYIKTIVDEINSRNVDSYNTIYIGGGSPSSLSYEDLKFLLENVSKYCIDSTEFTIEINPDDMSKDKYELLSQYHINRVSIGVQTLNEELLKTLNRKHTNQEVFEAINILRNLGINNISCDLMFGIEGQTRDDVINDVNKLVELKIPHISTYALLIEDHTYFKSKNISALDDDIQREYYDLISKILRKNGYIHYEISNFALSNFYSRHNLVYWEGKEYVGIGAGASGYEDSVRYTNTSSIKKYIEGTRVVESEFINEHDKEYEYIILSLRLNKGINFNEFEDRFKANFLEKYKDIVDELIKFDDVTITDSNMSVKEDKMFILNQIISKFN